MFDDRAGAAELGRRGAHDLAERHSPLAAGQVLERRLERVRARMAANAVGTIDVGDVPREAVERSSEIVARGVGASERGGMGGFARRVVLRLMRPYTAYQGEVNETVTRALSQIEAEAERRAAARAEAAELAAASVQASLLAELRRQRRLVERLADEGTTAQLAALQGASDSRIDDLSGQVDLLRRDTQVTARIIEGFDVGRDGLGLVLGEANDWPEGPEQPWTSEYRDQHRAFVVRALENPSLLLTLRSGRPLPERYGIGFDERVVEFPWLATRELSGRVLDAGSTLNHAHVLARLRPRVESLDIVTLTPEDQAFPQLDISYQYADLRDLPFRDAIYDTVVCVSTLEHVGMDNAQYGDAAPRSEDGPDALRRAVQELRRVLRPGGRMLVTVPFGVAADLGWQRVFDAAGLEALLAELAPSSSTVEIFRYLPSGWVRSTVDEAADAVYRDHFADPTPAADRAPAARAVACVDLRY